MRYITSVLLLLFLTTTLFAQHQFWVGEEPVFASSEDSIAFEYVNLKIRETVNTSGPRSNLDSLFQVAATLRTNVIGTVRTFKATVSFVSSEKIPYMTAEEKAAVRHVAIVGKQVRQFPKEVLACKNLEALELANTRIKRLPRQLKNMQRLQSVYILNNTPRGPMHLAKSKTIRTLGIRSNDPSTLPRTYKAMPTLEKLDLAANQLKQFPKRTHQLKYLKELLLSNNQLTLQNDRIKTHPRLEKMELTRNQIQHVPASIARFPALKRLTLNYNQISSVDDAIAQLTLLEQLSFYRNVLPAIPSGVYQLTSLKEVDLYYNQIESIDDRLANWKNLEVLYLSNNKLLRVPEAIGQLTNLMGLYLHNNRLSTLPASIGQLTRLKELRVNNNFLLEVPASLLQIQTLENLDLSGNQITRVPPQLFDYPSLKLLVLVENPWDHETRTTLPQLAEKLRARDAVVHVGL
ncbi:MAG: leucine-rich repeat domain-containing protein [Bacteroidota bacterium]